VDPTVRRHLSRDPVMRVLMRAAGPCDLRPRRGITPYQSLVSAIAHQQLTGKAAQTILGRFFALYGEDGRHPDPEVLLATDDAALRAVGFSRAKVASLKDIAARTLDGTIPPRRTLSRLPDDDIIARLVQVRGVGRWTVEMFLMFTLGRPDVLPVDDYGVRSGFRLAYGLGELPGPRELAAFGLRWAPYRSTAAWYLWRAVDLHKAGRLQ
jgi:DNA-3-methyladenine glycosylase II